MGPDRVVDVDGVRDRGACVSHRGEAGIKIELVLQDAVDAFGHGVLITVRAIRHARQHAQGLQLPEIGMTAVLTATIRVVHDARAVPERLLRGVEGRERAVMREVPPEVPADDVPRVQIRDEKQVRERAVREAEVGDVAHDDLAGRAHRLRLHQILRDRVLMARVGGLRRAAFPGHEASRGAQHGEEVVPADGYAGGRQRLVQFPRPDARLDAAERIDGVQHYGVRRGVGGASALPFVEGVARPAEGAADARDGVRGVGRLAEGGGSGIPKFFLMSIW